MAWDCKTIPGPVRRPACGLSNCQSCGDSPAAQRQHQTAPDVVERDSLDDWHAEQDAKISVQQREICVSKELLLTAIYADIEDCTLGSGYPVPTVAIEAATQSIMGTIEPFLAKPKPVSVDLEPLLDILAAKYAARTLFTSDIRAIIEIAYDAAGVPHVK